VWLPDAGTRPTSCRPPTRPPPQTHPYAQYGAQTIYSDGSARAYRSEVPGGQDVSVTQDMQPAAIGAIVSKVRAGAGCRAGAGRPQPAAFWRSSRLAQLEPLA
jgi:hypothetical protein